MNEIKSIKYKIGTLGDEDIIVERVEKPNKEFEWTIFISGICVGNSYNDIDDNNMISLNSYLNQKIQEEIYAIEWEKTYKECKKE